MVIQFYNLTIYEIYSVKLTIEELSSVYEQHYLTYLSKKKKHHLTAYSLHCIYTPNILPPSKPAIEDLDSFLI